MDNSFLVEEAYNQEAGVVQHIFTGWYGVNRQPGDDDRAILFSFTQEWPVASQTHQLSYTVPFTHLREGGETVYGVGDILLNYRWQALFDEAHLRALAPRVSLVLPSGSVHKGLGDDTVGGQFNLPFSTAVGPRWFLHANAGVTWLPSSGLADNQDLVHWNLGQSAIYALSRDFHLMLEWVGYWTEGLDHGRLRHEFSSLLSPGVRGALNMRNGSQLVLGLACPIGLTHTAPDFGVFFYLSFEHRFLKE